jgi:hypothetical protein
MLLDEVLNLRHHSDHVNEFIVEKGSLILIQSSKNNRFVSAEKEEVRIVFDFIVKFISQ